MLKFLADRVIAGITGIFLFYNTDDKLNVRQFLSVCGGFNEFYVNLHQK